MRLRRGTRVVDRGDGSVQVGVRPGLVLTSLTESERVFLERLESTRRIAPLQQRRWPQLIEALAGAGLIDDGLPQPGTVGVRDAGPMGMAIATGLAREGWSVRLVDPGPAVAAPPTTYALGTMAVAREQAGRATLKTMLPLAAVDVGEGPAEFWVLVSHGAAALDHAVELMAADIPHVFVVADERGARVGPVVLPGDSACGWCEGQARAAQDSAWPVVSLQLTAPGAPLACASADVTAAAAALVVGAVGAWRAGEAQAWLDSAWMLDTGQPPLREPVLRRATCGCGATGPIGDDVAARRARFPIA